MALMGFAPSTFIYNVAMEACARTGVRVCMHVCICMCDLCVCFGCVLPSTFMYNVAMEACARTGVRACDLFGCVYGGGGLHVCVLDVSSCVWMCG
jgi:hypothetical protein